MEIILDEVQASILLRLIKEQSINHAERRELISIEIQLQEYKAQALKEQPSE